MGKRIRRIEYEVHRKNKEGYVVHSIIQYTFSFGELVEVKTQSWDSNRREWNSCKDHGFTGEQKAMTPERLLAIVGLGAKEI